MAESPIDREKNLEVEQLVRTAKLFISSGRRVPGHVAAAMLRLQPWWKKHDIPAVIVAMVGLREKTQIDD